MNVRKVALSVVTLALTLTGSLAATATPAAAMACGNLYPATVGARAEIYRCQGGPSSIDFVLRDTASDGRRAELWLRHPGTSSAGYVWAEVTSGAGSSTIGSWGPYQSFVGVDVRVCTSNAGASRTCSIWY